MVGCFVKIIRNEQRQNTFFDNFDSNDTFDSRDSNERFFTKVKNRKTKI